MKKNKIIGILLLLIIPFCLSGYAIANFIGSTLASGQTVQTTEVDGVLPSLGQQTGADTALAVLNIIFGLLGIFGVVVGIPLGIYFLAKKDEVVIAELVQKEQYKQLTPEQVAYISKWSWGAFFGSLVWALGNRMYLWALLSLIPIVNLYAWLKLSIGGRAMSWEQGGWENFDQFKQRQKIVAWIILAFVILMIVTSVTGR